MSAGTAYLATAITASGIWAIRAAIRGHHRPGGWDRDRAYPTGPRTDTARKENRT
ncbi:hypothetical protein [Streptomyces odontomachi]|uniref:hypothetical protein n=1 Tax=Streptomyces odontomachi TaxID=2944940 RepID=UPI00210ACDAD|nr:hypothetical protein [Streptomyces sp. ODS25]